jgi:hypothetical protein
MRSATAAPHHPAAARSDEAAKKVRVYGAAAQFMRKEVAPADGMSARIERC